MTIFVIEGLKKIFTTRDISELSASPRGKYAFIDFLAGYFSKLGVKDKIDNNELNIIADFHCYNLEFAKEQLLLTDEKATLLLNIFAMLIAFKDFEPTTGSLRSFSPDPAKAKDELSNPSLKVPTTEEEDYRLALEQKFDNFKDALLSFSIDNQPFNLRVFTGDEVKKIIDYVMDTYFGHFRLYSYVLSNKQLSDQKSISVCIDEPLPIPPLSEGLMGNFVREEIEVKEDEEVNNVEQKQENQTEKKVEDSKEQAPARKDEKKEQTTNASSGPKLNKESEALINSKVAQFKNELLEKIGQKDIDKLIEDVRASNKAGK